MRYILLCCSDFFPHSLCEAFIYLFVMSAISQISCSNIVIAECRDCLQSRERQGLLPLSATGAACQLSVASDHVTGVKSPAIHLLRMKLALEFVLLLLGCCCCLQHVHNGKT